MLTTEAASWKDLDNRGFVHVPRFLSEEELAACRADYAEQPVDTGNRNYAMSGASERGVGPIRHRISDVIGLVNSNTTIQVDYILGGSYFATKRGVLFKWHQDHESYFDYQNHYDYLNFYIPVHKPVKEKSNLNLVPFDTLGRKCPRTFQRVVGRGATWILNLGTRQLVMQDETGGTHLLQTNIQELACTPELEAGDLLLMRGDMFHQTQDNDTDRVALSVRVAHSKTVVRRATLASGGLIKAKYMANNSEHYESMFRAFDEARRSEMTLGELLTLMNRLEGHAPSETGRFRNKLLREKIRNGVLLSSVRTVWKEAVARPMIARYHWRRLRREQHHASAGPAMRTT